MTTAHLAALVCQALNQPVQGRRQKKTHPATKTFQALRIEVNSELQCLTDLLSAAPDLLRKDGKIAIISFHSLEDKIVKEDFKSFSLLSDQDFEITKIKFPDPTVLNLSFSEEPVSVFEGEFIIGVIIDLPEDIKLGDNEIPVEFYYQACNDQTCEPPQAVETTFKISVVNSSTPVKEINKDIFAKLELLK